MSYTYRCFPSFHRTMAVGLLAFFIFQSSAQSSFATIIPILAPTSVQPGALQSDTDGFLFVESERVLASPVSVDITVPGTYDNTTPNSPGTIPAGTQVVSYFFHHESINNDFSTVVGTFSPGTILGIITSDANLDATDPILGHIGTSYPTGLVNRGLELPFPITPDTVVLNGNQVTISLASNTAAVMDQVRILVAVPEPASFFLAAFAIVCLIAYRQVVKNRSLVRI